MGRFLGSLLVERPLAGRDVDWWQLRRSIRYEGSVTTVIPADFITDFCSTPKPLWWIFPPTDSRYIGAAIVHDRLYETHEVSRRVADRVFREAAASTGTGFVKRWVMWIGLRLGGAWSYKTGPERQQLRKLLAATLEFDSR